MSEKKYRAYICCGPNCGPKDSRALLDYLSREVARLGLESRVSALPTGCQSHCLSGPTMVVYPGPVYYQEITTDRLDTIVEKHFVRDEPVQAFFWTGPRIKLIPRRNSAPRQGQFEQPKRQEHAGSTPRKPERKASEVDDFKW
jgi:(2Fe-2S) ferredoxin